MSLTFERTTHLLTLTALIALCAVIVWSTTYHSPPTLDPNPVCHLVKP